MSRILLTGGHGFVGSHLVRRLLDAGATVRCLYRGRGIPPALAGLDVEIAPGDVRDAGAVARALEGVDEVHHLAALTRSRTRREMLATNVGGTRTLLEAAARAGLPGRFVLCSSLAAAGPTTSDRPLAESDPPRPVTWYGESKLLAERVAARYADVLDVTVLRPGAVYGPRDRDLLAVFRSARRGLGLLPGGSPTRYHFLYVEDLAEAHLRVASSTAACGRTYFVAHPDALSPAAFLGHVEAALGRRTRRLEEPAAALGLLASAGELWAQLGGSPPLLSRQRLREMAGPAYLCRADALAAATGWRAEVGHAEGTRRTAAWYREAGWL